MKYEIRMGQALDEMAMLVGRSNARFGSRQPGPDALRRSAGRVLSQLMPVTCTWTVDVKEVGDICRMTLTIDGHEHIIPEPTTLEIMEESLDPA